MICEGQRLHPEILPDTISGTRSPLLAANNQLTNVGTVAPSTKLHC
jgi:hypothetical protein